MIFLVLGTLVACKEPPGPDVEVPTLETSKPPPEASEEMATDTSTLRGCVRPQVEAGANGMLVRLESKSVRLTITAPSLSGPDGRNVQELLRTLAKTEHIEREKAWTECNASSKLGLECAPWSVKTACETSALGHVFSVVCRNELTDELGGRPTIDYRSMNVTRCGGRLRVLKFEEDFCPDWSCLASLKTALLNKTGHVRPPVLEDDPAVVRRVASEFLIQKDKVIFYAGSSTLYDLDVVEGIPFGYNVLVLSRHDFEDVLPTAARVLQQLAL